MPGLDLTRLSPTDAVVVLRSLPRRFRAALAPPLDEDGGSREDDLLHRLGPDGRSALDHAGHVVRSLGILDRAVQQAVTSTDPVLHPAVIDDHARWSDDIEPSPDPAVLFDDLEAVAERFAHRVEGIHGRQWNSTARIAGDGQITAHDLLIEAVRTSVEHLRSAERTIALLRGQPWT